MAKKKRYCKYPDCPHSSVENVGCKLQLLPADHSKCRVWMRLCKFAGTPRLLPARIQICSCQLVDKNGPTKDNPNPLPYEVSMNEDGMSTLQCVGNSSDRKVFFAAPCFTQ